MDILNYGSQIRTVTWQSLRMQGARQVNRLDAFTMVRHLLPILNLFQSTKARKKGKKRACVVLIDKRPKREHLCCRRIRTTLCFELRIKSPCSLFFWPPNERLQASPKENDKLVPSKQVRTVKLWVVVVVVAKIMCAHPQPMVYNSFGSLSLQVCPVVQSTPLTLRLSLTLTLPLSIFSCSPHHDYCVSKSNIKLEWSSRLPQGDEGWLLVSFLGDFIWGVFWVERVGGF